MVEENLQFWPPEMPRIDSTLLFVKEVKEVEEVEEVEKVEEVEEVEEFLPILYLHNMRYRTDQVT